MGDLMIEVPRPRGVSKVRLTNVLYTLSIGYTLISLSQVDCTSYSTIIMEGILNIVDRQDNSIIGEISQENGIWQVKHDISDPAHASLAVNVNILHQMLGHILPAAVAKLVKDGRISGIELTNDDAMFCETYAASKIKRLPFPKECLNPAIMMGNVVHSDVWGPAQTTSLGGKRYWCTFIDEYSHWGALFFLKSKDKVLSCYKVFEAQLETQFRVKIKALVSDHGGEYLSNAFTMHLESKGTTRLLTVHDSPASNGIAEHVRAMLLESSLPKFLWAEVAHHVIWLRNRTIINRLQLTTPYQVLRNKAPDLSHMVQWGMNVWV
jgi:Integrase core domain